VKTIPLVNSTFLGAEVRGLGTPPDDDYVPVAVYATVKTAQAVRKRRPGLPPQGLGIETPNFVKPLAVRPARGGEKNASRP